MAEGAGADVNDTPDVSARTRRWPATPCPSPATTAIAEVVAAAMNSRLLRWCTCNPPNRTLHPPARPGSYSACTPSSKRGIRRCHRRMAATRVLTAPTSGRLGDPQQLLAEVAPLEEPAQRGRRILQAFLHVLLGHD